jgi:hypothetical protein
MSNDAPTQAVPAEQQKPAARFECLDYAGIGKVAIESAPASGAQPAKRPLQPRDTNEDICATPKRRRAAPCAGPPPTHAAEQEAAQAPASVGGQERAQEAAPVSDGVNAPPGDVANAAKPDLTPKAARKAKSAPKAAGARARDGGHANFVRMADKKGKSSFKFKSKSGSSQSNPKNRKWAARKMAQESLPVAGLGADSTRETRQVCWHLQHNTFDRWCSVSCCLRQ